MRQTSDENTSLSFESLPPEHQKKVLALKEAYRLGTIEEAMGFILGMVVEKAYREQKDKEAKHGQKK